MQPIANLIKERDETYSKSQPLTPTPASTSSPTEQELKRVPLTSRDGEDVCPTCNTPAYVGLFRRDVPITHSDFGKLIKCQDSFHAESRGKRLQDISNMGPKDIKRRLPDIHKNDKNAAMIDAAWHFIHQGFGWLYIWGGPGNAKSEVLKAMVNEINDTGRGPARYTNFGTILNWMRAAFDHGSQEYHTRFTKLVESKVLAIDEMDKPRETEWMKDFKFHLLNARYEGSINEQSLTIFAGNPNPADVFDEVLFDRFRDGRFRIVHNTAPSARQWMKS